MTTVTHPTQRPPLPARPRRNEHTGPIRRIIVGSLAAGVVAAAVLTVVVFGGADEYVITGTALLFGGRAVRSHGTAPYLPRDGGERL